MEKKIPRKYLKFGAVVSIWAQSSEAEDLVDLIVPEGIEFFTGGGPCHVMLFLGRGEYGRNTLWHVTSPSCRYDPLSSVLDKMDKIDLEIGHHKNLDKITRKNRRVIREACAGLQGTPYDYTELFFHLLQELELSDKDLSDPKLFVCSSGLRYVLSKGGLWFCRKDPLPSPQDIRKDKNYVCDWQWGDAPREA